MKLPAPRNRVELTLFRGSDNKVIRVGLQCYFHRTQRDGEPMTDLQAAKADPHCNELANVLAEARCEARQVRSLRPELVPTTHDSGYAVNRMVVERLGWEPLGWNSAGTTAAVREKLKIDRPIYGRTFKRFATQSPATLLHRELLDPLIEYEFFVTLADDLAPLLWLAKNSAAGDTVCGSAR